MNRCGASPHDSADAEGRSPAANARQWDNGPMTKSELIGRIAHRQSLLAERDVHLAVGMMLDHMAACLAGGGRIEIRGFASFSLRLRRARIARNPRTGLAVSLPSRYAVHFKPGAKLRERVNGATRGPSEPYGPRGREEPRARSGRRPAFGASPESLVAGT